MKRPRIEVRCQACSRTFEGTHQARYCRRCRFTPEVRGFEQFERRTKYRWDAEKDRVLREQYDGSIPGRAESIARAIGFPRQIVSRRARFLGLALTKSRPWTAEEEQMIVEEFDSANVERLARKLQRSVNAVCLKAHRLGVRAWEARDFYSLADVAQVFGVTAVTVGSWVKRGWLRARQRQEGVHGSRVHIREKDILAFMKAHPMAFRLSKVDQAWFLDLVFNGAVTANALRSAMTIAADEDLAEVVNG